MAGAQGFAAAEKGLSSEDYYDTNGQVLTSLPDAFTCPWTFPRAKNCSPALNFSTSVRTGAALSIPVLLPKKTTPFGVVFFVIGAHFRYHTLARYYNLKWMAVNSRTDCRQPSMDFPTG